ncbi:MAG TPA: hypothetical protein VFC53_14045 [Dehalococcoidia bacterium]|nr:hypothetical protein [Dehalococcoidia bacterium]
MRLSRLLYKGARIANDVEALEKPERLPRRVRNKVKGRILGRVGFWRRLWK